MKFGGAQGAPGMAPCEGSISDKLDCHWAPHVVHRHFLYRDDRLRNPFYLADRTVSPCTVLFLTHEARLF
jgi:hypothetical protein